MHWVPVRFLICRDLLILLGSSLKSGWFLKTREQTRHPKQKPPFLQYLACYDDEPSSLSELLPSSPSSPPSPPRPAAAAVTIEFFEG